MSEIEESNFVNMRFLGKPIAYFCTPSTPDTWSPLEYRFVFVCICLCWFILVCIGLYWFILVCIGLYWFVFVCICLYWFVLVYIGLYWFVLVCIGLYWFVLVCIGLYWFACQKLKKRKMQIPIAKSLFFEETITPEPSDRNGSFSGTCGM